LPLAEPFALISSDLSGAATFLGSVALGASTILELSRLLADLSVLARPTAPDLVGARAGATRMGSATPAAFSSVGVASFSATRSDGGGGGETWASRVCGGGRGSAMASASAGGAGWLWACVEGAGSIGACVGGAGSLLACVGGAGSLWACVGGAGSLRACVGGAGSSGGGGTAAAPGLSGGVVGFMATEAGSESGGFCLAGRPRYQSTNATCSSARMINSHTIDTSTPAGTGIPKTRRDVLLPRPARTGGHESTAPAMPCCAGVPCVRASANGSLSGRSFTAQWRQYRAVSLLRVWHWLQTRVRCCGWIAGPGASQSVQLGRAGSAVSAESTACSGSFAAGSAP
jgi:hypothetical protein